MTKTKQCKCGGGGIYNVHLETCHQPKDTREEKCNCGCEGNNKDFSANKVWDKKCIYYRPKETTGKDITVCPKHGNREYQIDASHFCSYKINEGCNCKCTCFKDPIVQDWREEFEQLFPLERETKQTSEEVRDEVKSFIEKVVSQQVSKALQGQKEKIEERIDEYFDGLVAIPDPQATKIKLKEFLLK